MPTKKIKEVEVIVKDEDDNKDVPKEEESTSRFEELKVRLERKSQGEGNTITDDGRMRSLMNTGGLLSALQEFKFKQDGDA